MTCEAPPKPVTEQRAKDKPKVDQPWQWHVVLLDDQDHSYEYVIRMMQELFAHPIEKAFKVAQRVDNDGRAICLTTHKEHAELKRDQILAYGKDPLLSRSRGSMSAIIEPAEFGDEDSDGAGTGDGRNDNSERA